MFGTIKTLANGAAVGLVLLATHSAHAITINVGTLPTDGTTLSFTGDTTIHGYDVYNFTLPFDILGSGGPYLHIETGNANYDTLIRLYSGFDRTGPLVDWDDDSEDTFGPCEHGSGQGPSSNRCSSIGAGDGPLDRYGTTDVTPLLAGDYSLEVEGYYIHEGTYELRFTSQIPEPGTFALFGLGLLGLGLARRRKAA